MASVKDKITSIQYMRIFAMLGIIAFHFTDHSPVDFNSLHSISLNWWFFAIARMGGGIGNCVFVLISGFLLCKKNKLNLSHLFSLYSIVLFYSIFSYYISAHLKFVPHGLFSQFFPIITAKYWFMSTYFLLIIFVPFINSILLNFKDKILKLILLIFCISSIIPTFTLQNYFNINSKIDIFILLYLVGGFIRIYIYEQKIEYLIKYRKVLIFLACLIFSLILFSEFLFAKYTKSISPDFFIWTVEKSPIIILTVLLFSICITLKPKLPSFIDLLSQKSFPVYLIHCGMLYPIFFRRLFNPENFFDKNYFIIWYVFATVSIYFICFVIDIIRNFIFNKLYLLKGIFLIRK
ncbi:acyltransferase [Mesosutterella sp. AGMB02718]|uniref:Acyltransferase n=1 Tax=Mesosutterella faecium TaxID=2925194 RepID=A0ABT7IM82_9BURK|nr:acyltransferase [Mesosutterella sp. AGMB02718]MDL2059468.1 acyltransferase [Mesosutterella sp. AGMB02718]